MKPNGNGSWLNVLRVLVGIVAIGGCGVLVAWGVYHYALESPRFALRQVQVEGLRRTGKEALLTRAKVRLGDNIFRIDLRQVEERIMSDPWIRSVRVERRLPAALRLEIDEREAGAIAIVGGKMMLVTKGGEVFKSVESGDPTDLPTLTGIDQDAGQRDLAWQRSRITMGLDVIRHYERTGLASRLPAQEAHVTAGGEVVLTVGRTGVALHLGAGPWGKKLSMAERVLGKMGQRNQLPQVVFLDNATHPERVVVRLR